MSDLRERLRSPIRYPGIEDEAADEIDRLEAQLASARKALRTSLTAMTLASGFEVISIEFEFRHAIEEVRAALSDEKIRS